MSTPQSSPIKNVFLLMLENHSFDHIFGFSDIGGVNGLSPGYTNTYKGKVYPAAQPAVDPMFTDPNHEFLDTMEQLCGPAYGPKGENPFQNNPKATYPPIDNSGFVRNYATIADEHTGLPKHHKGDVMRACSPNQVPVMIQLANEFAVCDNWFSSLPGPTWPNRLFSLAASSSGLDDSPSNSQILDWFKFWDKGIEFQNGSIFQLLKKHGFKVNFYSDWDNIYAPDPAPVHGGGWMPISAALHGNSIRDFTDIQHLAHHLKKPYPYQFTLIEPNYGDAAGNTYKGGSSQHPEDSLWAGEALVAATYNAIRKSRLWDTSLLIITYDEHGGYYDHAPPCSARPPRDTPPHDLNIRGFNFTQFGVRVPAVVVSPLIPKPTVDSTQYDHTSILKTVEQLFVLPNLTQRDLAANDVIHLLSGPLRTDCPETISAGPRPVVEVSAQLPTAAALADPTPLPEQGTSIGHFFLAMKIDHELSGGMEASKAAILARAQTIKTRGQLRRYVAEVREKVRMARALRT
jgi:phospholipase C